MTWGLAVAIDARERTDSLVDAAAVDLVSLRKHLRALAGMGSPGASILSCYTAFEHGLPRRDVIERRARAIRATLPRDVRGEHDLAIARIFAQLEQHAPRTRGMAVFASLGNAGLFEALEFAVPLPTLVALESAPVIYPLVELKDTFHRFIVVISTEGSARILEVDLGAVTRDLWTTAPPLPADVQQWSRQHYQNHRRDRADRFLSEKLALLEQLVGSHGHSHLILAGDARLTARIRDRLPNGLRAKLVDILPAVAAEPADVVQAALLRFIEHEEKESFDAAESLCRDVRRGEMAAIGTLPTIEALERGQGDLLVMTDSYTPGRGSRCSVCGVVVTAAGSAEPCASCGAPVERVERVDLREHLVRIAERTGCGFERVSHHDQLSMLGGVGCTLRYPRAGR